jgi:hypothetical protein
MKIKEGSLSHELRKKCISLPIWAENRGLSKNDKQLLRKISNGTIKGKRKGRTREIMAMLREDGLIA